MFRRVPGYSFYSPDVVFNIQKNFQKPHFCLVFLLPLGLRFFLKSFLQDLPPLGPKSVILLTNKYFITDKSLDQSE